MSGSFLPDEPPAAIWDEQATYASILLGAISYGVHITVFFLALYSLTRARKPHFKKWIIYVCLLFGLGTVNVCINMRFGQLVWIDNRGYPGGPFIYIVEQSGSRLLQGGNAESIIIPILTDGLLIYRCYALYHRWWIPILPTLALIGALACGILLDLQTAHPNSSLFTANTIDFSLPYFAISMGLNMLLSLLLVGRLLWMRHRLHQTLGSAYTRLYSTIAVIILESALPYALVSLVFIVLYGTNNTAAVMFIPLTVQLECISPMLIIVRVARGQAWTNETIRTSVAKHRARGKDPESPGYSQEQEMSVIRFSPGEAGVSTIPELTTGQKSASTLVGYRA
ncbi:hypothetical protein NP233_g4165 [Leucocoprinus birnbaumii]|uniref:Uncharacterized protein n=1 Tax=Leucocoprinus birnbaumii TaxID=56174 RepID=A0AAD5VVW3_9AGAR|nr:hypothetical protein NP233_g4165 [Leucocoprinus birnbaumii]